MEHKLVFVEFNRLMINIILNEYSSSKFQINENIKKLQN